WLFSHIPAIVADCRVHPANLHVRNVIDYTEEAAIETLLAKIFAETESDSDLESRKQRARRKIYASQYIRLADKYFGHWMTPDARRCYLKAITWDPQNLLSFTVLRRLAATGLSEQNY